MLSSRPSEDDINLGRLTVIRDWVDGDLTRLEAGTAADASSFSLIANWHWARSVFHSTKSRKMGVDLVNWGEWRLGLEYADLFIRACPSRRISPIPTDISFFIEVAFSRVLTSHPKAAERVLRGTEKLIVNVVNKINSYTRTPIILEGDLDIIGLLYDRVTGTVPKHRVFHRASPEVTKDDLLALPEKRKRYAKKGRPEGAFLDGYSYELVPLEALFVNSLLPEAERDPSLTLMAEAIAATEYPDDPVLEGYDARLSALGL